MPRARLTELNILTIIGICEVVRRQTLHLLPSHYVTVNNTIKEMLTSGLIKEREKGYQKHFILSSKGRSFLRQHIEEFHSYQFLPSNIRSRSWKRLMLVGDVFLMLNLCDYNTYPWNRESLDSLQALHAPSFYPAMEIKQFLGDGRSVPSLQYSRLTGLLLAPDAPYRIYHTRNVAMEIRMTGERSMLEFLRNKLYTQLGYHLQNTSPVLLYGDRDMVSAEKILYNTLYPDNTANQLRGIAKQQKKPYQITKLIDAQILSSQTYYIPLCKDAMPLLRLYALKGGLEYFRESIFHNIIGESQVPVMSKILRPANDRNYFFVADFHISWIGAVLCKLDATFRRGTVTIICLAWQLDFWQRMFQQHFPGRSYDFYVIRDQYVTDLIKWLTENPR